MEEAVNTSLKMLLGKKAFDRGSSLAPDVRALTVADDAVERWWWFEAKLVG